jgi:hypothetical protein
VDSLEKVKKKKEKLDAKVRDIGKSEVGVLIESINFDNDKLSKILNPNMAKGESADKSYKEAKNKLKDTIIKRKWAEGIEDKEEGIILDDYDSINNKLKDLGLLKIGLDNAKEDLGMIKKALPGIKNSLLKIKGLIKERERL